MINARDQDLLTAVGKVLTEEVEPLRKRIEQLERKINELEVQAEHRRYVGVWATGKYHEGNMCTLDGSVWHCNQETTQRPGTGPDWTLAIKRGQNGRDGVAAPRQPSAERSYGR
jgi:hypothetical protein